MKKSISALLCLIMVLAMCFTMAACGKKADTAPTAAALVDGQTYGTGIG